MRTSTKDRLDEYHRLRELGFTSDEATALRRISLTLHRWDESECGDGNDRASWCVERDDVTGKPFRVVHPHQGKSYRTAIPDREAGALKKLVGIMANHPKLTAYHQGDCRGCALYILRAADLRPGDRVDQVYSRGLAVG